jgi:DNA-binding PadR family transcriptional regulator
VLLPLEEAVLEIGLRHLRDGEPDFYGFAMAEALDDATRSLTAHGTLYKTLDRLERGGLLSSRWEDIDTSEAGRPRRRLYRVTDAAGAALETSRALLARTAPRPRLATS